MLSLALAIGVASPFGCALDEGSVHPCVVFGLDLGALLYVMAVAGWMTLFTAPLAAIALAGWLVVALVMFAIRRRRMRQNRNGAKSSL